MNLSNIWQILLILGALSLPFFAMKCAGDPDQNCIAVCERHGTTFEKRISRFLLQECICLEQRRRR